MLNHRERFPTLANLADGALQERFDKELNKVLKNIMDPNTKPDATRSITIKIDIKPDEMRYVGSVVTEVKSKLAPDKQVSTLLYFGQNGDFIAATEKVPPDQMQLSDLEVVDSAEVAQ